MSEKQINDLPESGDEFWDGEKIPSTNRTIDICPTHARDNYMDHFGYVDNHDGVITCKFCPWGAKLPGYLRVSDGRLFDLRHLDN